MFPIIALVTPLFAIERALGLFNTWPGLIIPYVAFGLPLGIYTLSAFFREIPWELEKAAKVDGATPFQAFIRVIAPLAAVTSRAARAYRQFPPVTHGPYVPAWPSRGALRPLPR